MSSTPDWRERLECRGRTALDVTAFAESELLFRGFRFDELDVDGRIDIETLRMPDLSCNWSRFSAPDDVRRRMAGCENDGCYAIKVSDVRYEKFATPVHDPLCQSQPENYSHAEIRELLDGEAANSIPPKNRKPAGKRRKMLRLNWRTYLVNQLQRIFDPGS